jgi:hypothetical protein
LVPRHPTRQPAGEPAGRLARDDDVRQGLPAGRSIAAGSRGRDIGRSRILAPIASLMAFGDRRHRRHHRHFANVARANGCRGFGLSTITASIIGRSEGTGTRYSTDPVPEIRRRRILTLLKALLQIFPELGDSEFLGDVFATASRPIRAGAAGSDTGLEERTSVSRESGAWIWPQAFRMGDR